MASARLYDFSGDVKGKVDLPVSLFDAPVNRHVLYEVVHMYLANRRAGTANTKLRSEVRFSKRKPYRQKGTGRARAGKRSSPLWRGGGTVFGPRPRDYRYSVPRKVKRAALKAALTDKGREEDIVIVEGVAVDEPKTKRFADFFLAAGLGGKRILFLSNEYDENVYKSTRNLPGVEYNLSRNLNAYDVLRADALVITKEALATLEEVFA
jgi:large subunit ribosomal protein L4